MKTRRAKGLKADNTAVRRSLSLSLSSHSPLPLHSIVILFQLAPFIAVVRSQRLFTHIISPDKYDKYVYTAEAARYSKRHGDKRAEQREEGRQAGRAWSFRGSSTIGAIGDSMVEGGERKRPWIESKGEDERAAQHRKTADASKQKRKHEMTHRLKLRI